MTKKRARIEGAVTIDRLVERCRGPYLKTLINQIAPAITGLGYDSFNDKTPCMIGSHKIVTLELPDECLSVGCPRPVKLQWSVCRGVLEKGCGSYDCPCDEYAVQTDQQGDITLHHIAHHNHRMKVAKPAPQHIRTDLDDDPMIVAANEAGMKLAHMLKKLNNPMTDVYDGKHWWYFKREGGDGRWHIDKAGLHIHRTVNDSIIKHYSDLKRSKKTKACDEVCDGLIKRVNTRQFRDPLVKDCCATFHDPAFLSKLNSKPNLIGCKNGVFDIDAGEFRPGKPTDYLTFSTNVDYLVEDIHDRLEYAQLQQFLVDVLGLENARVMHTYVCQYLHGETNHSRFFMWVGGGSNGKSKLQSLYRMSLGDYAITMPSQVITGKQVENGKACPELRRGQWKRLIFFSEPSTNETLASGTAKLITGGDLMYVRGLYEDGSEIKISGLPICCCNETPNVNDQSEGVWRRLVEVPFNRHFVKNPNPENPNEKEMDGALDVKLRTWKEVFLTDMLRWAHECRVNPERMAEPHMPNSIRVATDRYRSENDYYSEFFNEKIVKTGMATDSLQWTDVWDTFRSWMGRSYGWDNLPKRLEARKKLEGGKCFNQKLYKGTWAGFLLPRQCTSQSF